MRWANISGALLLFFTGGAAFLCPFAVRQQPLRFQQSRSSPINNKLHARSCQRVDIASSTWAQLRGGWGGSWSRRQSSSLEVKKAAADEEDALGTKPSVLAKPITIQGIELTWDVIAILVVYFVQGALGLARGRGGLLRCSLIVVTKAGDDIFLKDELQLAPADVAALSGLFTLPWVFKPLYGFLSDGLPVFGYRRRSYMVLSGLIGASGWLYLANFAQTPFEATAASIVASLGVAVSDVVADSIVVEKIHRLLLAGFSLCVGAARPWGNRQRVFFRRPPGDNDNREVFSLTAYLPLLIMVCAIFIDERRLTDSLGSPKQIISEQAANLWSAVKNKSVWLPALFIFLWRATPSSESAYFFFLTNDIGIGPEFLGRVRLGSSIASLVGVWIFQTFLKEIKTSRVLFWTTLVSLPLGFTQLLLVYHLNRQLGIPDEVFTFGDDVVLTVLGQIAFMPTLVLAARLCPPGVEGTLFALLMSIYNGGAIVGSELGAYLTKVIGVTDTDFRNLGLLITVCTLSSLIPLPFLKWVDSVEKEQISGDVDETATRKRNSSK